MDAGFAAADIVVENTYSVPVREHAAMEPEAALAYEEGDDRIVIETPLYHPFVQGQLSIAANLDVSSERVRIVCPAMGGNFGTRGDTLAAVVVALLARRTGKAGQDRVHQGGVVARILQGSGGHHEVQDRSDEKTDESSRSMPRSFTAPAVGHRFLIPTTTKGAELCFYETLGALLSHATGPYYVPNVRARAYDVLTNGPRCVPLRGTNGNYLPLAYESQIELLAARLGWDPLELAASQRPRGGLPDPCRASVGRKRRYQGGAGGATAILRTGSGTCQHQTG